MVDLVFNLFVTELIPEVREAQVTSYLANWTQHETKSDSGPQPTIFKNTTSALKVEHVSAVELEKRLNENKCENVKVKPLHLLNKQSHVEIPVQQEQQKEPL